MNRLSLRSKLLIGILVVVGVALPLQFWHSVWFGRELNDRELGEYLDSYNYPRKIQHALAQIEERIRESPREAQPWHSKIAALVEHPSASIRSEAAWVMGQDNQSSLFHEALIRLLADPEHLVRRNAALALARFGDHAALPELRTMLEETSVLSSASGKLEINVKEGEWVSAGATVGRIAGQDVRSPLPGRVVWTTAKADATVGSGQEVVRLSPDPASVWEALRALYLIGGLEELPLVESIAAEESFEAEIQKQARFTRDAILARSR